MPIQKQPQKGGVSIDLLQEIYAHRTVQEETGYSYPLTGSVTQEHAVALYRAVLSHKPRVVVEIGMAYGVASLAILAALRDGGEGGKLISIDPNQMTQWKGIGIANVNRCNMAAQHELLETFDYLALPELIKRKTKVDFAYVDGWHTFDYVLLDFFLLDKILRPSGVIGFNDCGLRAVHKVLRFVQTHRKYQELDVGLKRDFRGRNLFITGFRWIFNRPRNDRYFQKQEMWEPDWNFYRAF